MEKLTDQQVLHIIQEAQRKAAEASEKYLKQIGGDQYPCGFAWVNIKPARGQFVKVMKANKIGRKDDYYGGYTVYNPSGNFCQNMDVKKEGAKVFADHLRMYGIDASVNSRMD